MTCLPIVRGDVHGCFLTRSRCRCRIPEGLVLHVEFELLSKGFVQSVVIRIAGDSHGFLSD